MKKENLIKLLIAIIMGVLSWYVSDQASTDSAQWRAIGEIRKQINAN